MDRLICKIWPGLRKKDLIKGTSVVWLVDQAFRLYRATLKTIYTPLILANKLKANETPHLSQS